MKEFLIILAAIIVAFAGTFFILQRNNPANDEGVDEISVPGMLRSTFELSLGGFDTTSFGKIGFPLIYFVFIISSIFLIVVMLNLLIAIISESFTVV